MAIGCKADRHDWDLKRIRFVNCLKKDRYARSNRVRAIFQLKLLLGELIIGRESVSAAVGALLK